MFDEQDSNEPVATLLTTDKQVNLWSYKTPGGVNFSVFRDISPDVVNAQAKALDQMFEVARKYQPGFDSREQELSQGTSAINYKFESLINDAERHVKEKVANIFVAEQITEGSGLTAITTMLDHNFDDVELNDLKSTTTIGKIFESAESEGDDLNLWLITEQLSEAEKEGRFGADIKILKDEEDKFASGWTEREKAVFERRTQKAIEEFDQEFGNSQNLDTLTLAKYRKFMAIQDIYDTWKHRDEGFEADTPNPISQEVARRMIKYRELQGNHDLAYEVAIESRLPENEVKPLEDKLPKKGETKGKFARIYSQLAERFSRQ